MNKTWFITGASSGFGRACAEKALEAGDKVAACARRFELLEELAKTYGEERCMPIQLDVTDRMAVNDAVKAVIGVWGGIDVLLSNAGIGYYNTVEECDIDILRVMMETNVYGSLNVIQAVLPHMRAKKSGHIIQVSSMGGAVIFPLVGAYSASKWAVEALGEALAIETEPFGIKVTLVEPGPFETGFQKACIYPPKHLPVYEPLWQDHFKVMQSVPFPPAEEAAQRICEVANMAEPPARLALGPHILELIRQAVEKRLDDWTD